MAAYTVINELRSIEFHDSFLEKIEINHNELHMVFSDTIIIGNSRLDIEGRIPCSANCGEDRYACPELNVIIKDFTLLSVLRGGCWTQDAEGNTIEKYPPRNLSPEEYDNFLQMVLAEQGNQVYGLNYNADSMIYTLCFFMNEDANYYEMEFSTKTAIAEFEEFGEEAWYLDSKWRNQQVNE